MARYYKVIDTQKAIAQNYFSLVFFRGENVKNEVSLLRWIWLCLIEMLFGEELLESIVTTASNSGCPEDKDKDRKYGEPSQLNLHIPNGILTNLFRRQIIQVLYYKFYLQYLFLLPVTNPYKNVTNYTIDVSRIRFRFRKSLLYLVIAFRRVYLFAALILNIAVDISVYLISESVFYAIAAGFIIELLRRLFKI